MEDTKPGKRCKKSEYRQDMKERKVRNRKEKHKREKGKQGK
jgi:hypothetical protein